MESLQKQTDHTEVLENRPAASQVELRDTAAV
jgi:hypothetical protein